MKALKCLVIIFCFSALTGFSQEANISIQFTTLSWERMRGEKLFFQSYGQEPTEITLSPRRRSEAYRYVGPSPLVFFKKVTNAEGEIVQMPVTSVAISPEKNDQLFLFVRSSDGAQTKIYPMDDSESNFPPGSVRFFNMTSRNLGVIYDGEKIPLHPYEMRTASSKNEFKRVNLAILAIRDEELRDIYNAQWGQSSHSRYLIFIKDSEMRIDGVETKSIAQHFR